MTLSSVLVQRQVATMRQVEEALARQVIYGGDFSTNLLEVAPVDEAALTGLLAETARIPPAPAGELPMAPEPAQLIPLEIAAERGVVPISLEGEILVLAVISPMPAELEERLMFSLGVAIEQRAAPAVRVHQAIARLYGQPLDARMRRLLARLSGQSLPPGTTPTPPPAMAASIPASRPSPPRESNPYPRRVASGTPPVGIPLARIALASDRAGERVSAAPTTASAAPVRRRSSGALQAIKTSPQSTPAMPESAECETHPVTSAPAEPEVEAKTHESLPPPTPVVPERRNSLIQREVPSAVRSARRRRGPITLEIAKHDVVDIADRDALLGLFFDFARQFFDYATLFSVHGDIAEGRDAFGAGATRERVLGIGIPLDLPSLLSTARDRREAVVGSAIPESLDAVLLADLQRPPGAQMAVVPIAVRKRVVALFLGDCGEGGIEGEDLEHVTSLTSVVGKALERIIAQRKRDGGAPSGKARDSGPPSVPTPPESVRAASPVPPPIHIQVSMSSMPPPPANVLNVRRISGPPIPREEPEDARGVRIMTPPPPPQPPGANPARATTPSASPPKAAASPAAPPPTAAAAPANDVPADLPISEDLDSKALFDLLGWETGAEVPEAAPPSSAMALPPHRPPLGHAAPADELPSVIVDLDQELATIVDRVISGDADESAEGELLRQGERAMRVIMARFPGPVTVDRSQVVLAGSPPRASECGPILRLVARERKVALPFVLERLSDPDLEVRGWATHLLCELPYTEAIPHALARLRDPEASIRTSAAHAVAAVVKAFPDATRDAVRDMLSDSDLGVRVSAVRAIGRLRLTSLVGDLVTVLETGDERIAGSAHDALVLVTCQDFGSDPKAWRKWWEGNGSRHRVEWLIDALTHDVSEIRRSAGEELRATTREYFGYSSELPPRDRERTQQRYRDWWITEGRARFRRR